MATVETSQGTFEVCFEPHPPEGHVGPVWHPGVEHPSGATLKEGEQAKLDELVPSVASQEAAAAEEPV